VGSLQPHGGGGDTSHFRQGGEVSVRESSGKKKRDRPLSKKVRKMIGGLNLWSKKTHVLPGSNIKGKKKKNSGPTPPMRAWGVLVAGAMRRRKDKT